MDKKELQELLEKAQTEREFKEALGEGKIHAGKLDTRGLHTEAIERREQRRSQPEKKPYGQRPPHERLTRHPRGLGYSEDGDEIRVEVIREDANRKRQLMKDAEERKEYEKLISDLAEGR
jgi:hypothetical protein